MGIEYIEPITVNIVHTDARLDPLHPPIVTCKEVTPESSKNSLGHYLMPFFMYFLVLLYAVVIAGLLVQHFSHHDNIITRGFWGFLHLVNDIFTAWSESEPESE